MARKKPASNIQKNISTEVVTHRDHRILWFRIILFVFAFILYGNTLRNGYSLDDLYVTYNNPVVQQGVKAIPKIFTSLYININAEGGGTMNFGYRPVAKAMFAVEHELFGDNPTPSHLMNVILYGLNILLLFNILRRLLHKWQPWFPFFISLLWAAHPLHTEVVASLKNREEILSFIFGLVSIHFFLRNTEKLAGWKILAGAFAFLLSLISKPGTLPFIVAIPLILYFFTDAKPKTLAWTTFALLAIFYISLQIVKYSMPFANRPILFIENPLLFEENFLNVISTGFYVLLYYIRLLLYPHPLLFYYGYDMIPVVNFSNPWVILSIVVHIVLFVYAIWKIREKHLLSFAILFYLVNISMYSNFVKQPTGIVAERFLYIASLSFCIALVYFLFKLFRQPAGEKLDLSNALRMTGVVLILLIPYTARTIVRNKDWKSEISLYSHDLKYLGRSAKAHYIYAHTLKSEMIQEIKRNSGDKTGFDEEINKINELLLKTIEIYPGYFEAWNTLGEISSEMRQDYRTALKYFSKAAEVRPTYAPAWYNMAYARQQLGESREAIPLYWKAFELDSTYVVALSNLGKCYKEMNQLDSAILVNQKVIRMRPRMVTAYQDLIYYYLLNEDTTSAVPLLEQIDQIHPNDRRVVSVLYLYYKARDKEKAAYYREVLINTQPRRETPSNEPQQSY